MNIAEKITPVVKKTGEGLKKIDWKKPLEKFKKSKKSVKITICVLLVIAIVLGIVAVGKIKSKKAANSESAAQNAIVMRGNITNSITGSGTVEPIEQREIVPLVNGKITQAPFEEGDEVKENDVLYMFEMTSAENAIKSAENSVEKARTSLSNRNDNIQKAGENISKLTVKATSSGKISGLSLNVGEEVSGKICTVTNYKNQTATVPFSSASISKIKVGDGATVAIDKYMINAQGTVTRKYSASETLQNGAVVYNVEIRLSGEYVVEENVNVTATVHTSYGDIDSASYGSVKYDSPVTVNAEQKGKVSKVNVKNGDWVNKGDVIVTLTNSDLTDSLKEAQQNLTEAKMSLSEAENNLEDRMEAAQDYIVTSPINGTVLTKDYTVGDTVSGQNATTMMVVADMSKMKFTISVDELDISKIKTGQSVQVSADALENESIEGKITSVSKLGTASNGVTTYPIEVTIDEPGDLMPGMNVSAEIIVEEANDCLYLPVDAVEYFDGKYYVTVVGETETMPVSRDMPTEREESFEKKKDREENGFDAQKENDAKESLDEKDKKDFEKKEHTEEEGALPRTNEKQSGQKRGGMKIKLSGKEERIQVEVGISNDEYYEIKSGVEEGTAVKTTTKSTSSQRTQTEGGMPGGGMPGGMPGGGMPGGGMQGGTRGGGGAMGGRR